MRIAAATAFLLLFASPVFAIDVAGKWGIGAGINRGEVTLLHGHSDRTLWGADVFFNLANQKGGPFDGSRHFTVGEIGPRLRRLALPGKDFTPYFDVFVHGTWATQSETHALVQPFSSNSFGALLGLGMGVEYFTPWRFSVAGHSDFFRASFERNHTRFPVTTDQSQDFWSTEFDGTIQLNPTIFLRAYF